MRIATFDDRIWELGGGLAKKRGGAKTFTLPVAPDCNGRVDARIILVHHVTVM